MILLTMMFHILNFGFVRVGTNNLYELYVVVFKVTGICTAQCLFGVLLFLQTTPEMTHEEFGLGVQFITQVQYVCLSCKHTFF